MEGSTEELTDKVSVLYDYQVGDIYEGEVPPEDGEWLKCDGGHFLNEDYPNLSKILRYKYGPKIISARNNQSLVSMNVFGSYQKPYTTTYTSQNKMCSYILKNDKIYFANQHMGCEQYDSAANPTKLSYIDFSVCEFDIPSGTATVKYYTNSSGVRLSPLTLYDMRAMSTNTVHNPFNFVNNLTSLPLHGIFEYNGYVFTARISSMNSHKYPDKLTVTRIMETPINNVNYEASCYTATGKAMHIAKITEKNDLIYILVLYVDYGASSNGSIRLFRYLFNGESLVLNGNTSILNNIYMSSSNGGGIIEFPQGYRISGIDDRYIYIVNDFNGTGATMTKFDYISMSTASDKPEYPSKGLSALSSSTARFKTIYNLWLFKQLQICFPKKEISFSFFGSSYISGNLKFNGFGILSHACMSSGYAPRQEYYKTFSIDAYVTSESSSQQVGDIADVIGVALIDDVLIIDSLIRTGFFSASNAGGYYVLPLSDIRQLNEKIMFIPYSGEQCTSSMSAASLVYTNPYSLDIYDSPYMVELSVPSGEGGGSGVYVKKIVGQYLPNIKNGWIKAKENEVD